MDTLALALRYYVCMKYFQKLLIDDFFAGCAFLLLLSSAMLWTVIINDMYSIVAQLSGWKPFNAKFLDGLETFNRGSLAAVLMFYLGLCAIKISFLVFFYSLGEGTRGYRVYWWAVTLFTVTTGVACIATIPFECFARPASYTITHCITVNEFQEDLLPKLSCAWDVVTDALSMSLVDSLRSMLADEFSYINANFNPLENSNWSNKKIATHGDFLSCRHHHDRGDCACDCVHE